MTYEEYLNTLSEEELREEFESIEADYWIGQDDYIDNV